MYRFNDQDRRLARLVSLIVMVMESFAESEELREKYHYSVVGHSGDDAWIDLGVDFGNPPTTPKDRYAVVRKMIAHSEYTQSGDHSLEGTIKAVKCVAEEEADDYFVLVVSDANLSRYGYVVCLFVCLLGSSLTIATEWIRVSLVRS